MLATSVSLIKSKFVPSYLQTCFRAISTSQSLAKAEDRKQMMRSLPKPDEGIQGAETVDIDHVITKDSLFPDEDTPNRLFNGVPYKDTSICNIKVSKNNTIITVCDSKGKPNIIRSCGVEGFKHARKGTNIAAQATAITIAQKAYERGIKQVRVTISGMGPGRMSAIKGLTMGGLNVISVTDTTPVSWNPPRPRKVRRL
ncbi:small ribosomal subunit protein uS11m [Culicoides brevitarsis]|uniref:small ribosomal subunit protein uS11m n=1 Tax=Culicoides brevitarsis TaxID=469753 RepID=UPI00307C1D40